ncbi:MAG: hypothetical protein AB7W28_11365 [Armatimonadota bacterium]
MSYAAGVFLAIVGACVATLLAVQVEEYVHGRSLLTPRHLALRLVTGLLLLLVIVGVFIGVLWPFHSALNELFYWFGLLLGACAVAFLAILDLRIVDRVKHQRRAELYRRIAEAEAQLRSRKERKE